MKGEIKMVELNYRKERTGCCTRCWRQGANRRKGWRRWADTRSWHRNTCWRRGKPVQPVAADGQTAGAAETDRGGSVGLHDQIVEGLREDKSGGEEHQSGGYDGDDQTSKRSSDDSSGNRDAGSNLQAEVIDTDIEEGTAVAVPSFFC